MGSSFCADSRDRPQNFNNQEEADKAKEGPKEPSPMDDEKKVLVLKGASESEGTGAAATEQLLVGEGAEPPQFEGAASATPVPEPAELPVPSGGEKPVGEEKVEALPEPPKDEPATATLPEPPKDEPDSAKPASEPADLPLPEPVAATSSDVAKAASEPVAATSSGVAKAASDVAKTKTEPSDAK